MHSLFNISERQLILFDLDGTLVDSARDLYRSMNLTLNDLGRASVSEAQIRIWVGKGAAQLCQCVIEHQDGTFDAVQHAKLLTHFLQTYQANVCVDTVLYEGVQAFLDYCQTQHKILACVTNKPYAPTCALLKALDLFDRFDDVIGGDSLAQRKPHPLPLLHVLQQRGIAAAQSLMIGDSSNDVEAARRAGIDCIVMSYGYNHGQDIHLCQPQLVIDSLQQLIP